jgi:UDP-N-acetylglucosamine--N-acetylmuramyl-(pentapeptide) pyrophosphoryl-undecaprenol N-acetylglucosamine transferase
LKTILIVAAGTGGHLYPGMALARAIRIQDPEARVVFAVRRGDMGRKLLEREKFEVREFSGQGFPRSFSWKLFTFPFSLCAGFLEARSVLRELKPQVVVGMGGYLSFPLLLAARRAGIRTLIHEQNVLPGLANRLLGRKVDAVAVSFSGSRKRFKNSNVLVSGLPVRSEIGKLSSAEGREHLGLAPGRFTVLVFGGSLGASSVNDAVIKAWNALPECREWQVVHITGSRGAQATASAYKSLPIKAVVMPYCHDMAAAYAAADVVVSRSGASTVAELSIVRKPAVLVPYPFASENHQALNAETLVLPGAARMILDKNLNEVSLAGALRAFSSEDMRQAAVKSYDNLKDEVDHTLAADRLAEWVLQGTGK